MWGRKKRKGVFRKMELAMREGGFPFFCRCQDKSADCTINFSSLNTEGCTLRTIINQSESLSKASLKSIRSQSTGVRQVDFFRKIYSLVVG